MSASTLASHGLRMNNPHIERILVEQKDLSIFNKKVSLQRITEDLESSLIATSISENKTQQIENILYSKAPLVTERNAILNNLFKYYNPYYRHKLRKIDAKLDALDLQLYVIESEASHIKSDLNKEIESAREELKKALEKNPRINIFKK